MMSLCNLHARSFTEPRLHKSSQLYIYYRHLVIVVFLPTHKYVLESHSQTVSLLLFFLFISKFMRSECRLSKYVYDRRLPVSRLVSAVGDSIFY